MLNLKPAQRRDLRGRAHALHPVVFIGDKGLSQTVIAEIASSLDSHELIKVRVEADREARNTLLEQICEQLEAAPVQHIGKVLVIYRPAVEDIRPAPKRRSSKKARRTKRDYQNN